MLPRAQRERRDRIVYAALDLLEHDEYERIQVRDVSEHAGVALGTLYRYFSSKEHLYAAVLLEWSKSFKPPSTSGADSESPDGHRLLALLSRAVRAFERKPQMLRAEIAIESTSDENARKIFYRFGFQNHDVMNSAVQNTPKDRSVAILETVNSVLAIQLRYWALGLCSIEHVHAALARTVGLIFPEEFDLPTEG